MKKSIEKIISLLCALSLVLILTACSSGNSTVTDSTENETGLEGLWIYEGPSNQDPSYIVNLIFNKDNSFSLEANNNITSGENPTDNTSNIEGTYEAANNEITLYIEKITNSADIQLMVEEDKEYTVSYELSADNDSLELNGISEILKDIPESIKLTKGNQ